VPLGSVVCARATYRVTPLRLGSSPHPLAPEPPLNSPAPDAPSAEKVLAVPLLLPGTACPSRAAPP